MNQLPNFYHSQQSTAPNTPPSNRLPLNKLVTPFFSDCSSDSEFEEVYSPVSSCKNSRNVLKPAFNDSSPANGSSQIRRFPDQSVPMKSSLSAAQQMKSRSSQSFINTSLVSFNNDIALQQRQHQFSEQSAKMRREYDSDESDLDEELADAKELEPEYVQAVGVYRLLEKSHNQNENSTIGAQFVGSRRTRQEAHMTPADCIKGHRVVKRARRDPIKQRGSKRLLRMAKTNETLSTSTARIPPLTRMNAQRFMNIYNKSLFV